MPISLSRTGPTPATASAVVASDPLGRCPRTMYCQLLDAYEGDLDLLPELISSDCVLHIPQLRANALVGIEGFTTLIRAARAPFFQLNFTIVVGPLFDDSVVCARWRATGTYRGGIERSSAPAGTAGSFGGHDFLRIEQDRFVEYWGGADDVDLLMQIGAF